MIFDNKIKIIDAPHCKSFQALYGMPLTLDTETSSTPEYIPGEDYVEVATPTYDYMCGRSLYVPQKLLSKDIKKIFKKVKIKLTDGGMSLEELRDEAPYLFADELTPEDILSRLIFDLENELEYMSDNQPERTLYNGWIYQWAICIDAVNEKSLTGRSVVELVETLKKISNDFDKISFHHGKTVKVKIYVHNLSYDYTYLYKYLVKEFDDIKEFWLDSRHILKSEFGNIIMCDSLRYLNMSLEKACETYNVKHKKLVGTVDYHKLIFTDTPLTDEQWDYQLNDVYGLQECLIADFNANGYTVATAPMTSTGKVRLIVHAASDNDENARKEFLRTIPTVLQYRIMRFVFAGGYTHGNRFYRGVLIDDKILNGRKIVHRDFRSFYPSEMRTRLFPIGRIEELKKPTIEDFLNPDYCQWGIIRADGVRLKDVKCPCPFISSSKLDCIQAAKICDNGRVLECDEKFNLFCCDEDLRIYLDQYEFDNLRVVLCYRSKKAPLPKWFTDVIDDYYKRKSDKKALVKALQKALAPEDDVFNAEMELLFSKQFLNGLYGMCAMDFCRPEITRDEEGNIMTGAIKYTEQINKHYGIYKNRPAKRSNGFLPYQWAIYVTAYCRSALYEMMCIVGENFLYADTDSIFYMSDEDIEKKINAVNKYKYDEAIKKGAYITTDNGEIITYDSFDYEDSATQFKFLHSKCYAYVNAGTGKLKVTIAGVATRRVDGIDDNGEPVYYYNHDELNDIDNLKDGFIFKKCGSHKVQYYAHNAELVEVYPGKFENVADCAVISENEKTLNLGTDDFIINYYDMIMSGKISKG